MTFAVVLTELASELALFAAAGFLLFAIDDPTECAAATASVNTDC